MNSDKKSLLAFADRERNAFENALKEFVEIPTVSSEPERKGDIRRCADRAASLIREHGGAAEVLETAEIPGRSDIGALRTRLTAVKNHSCADFQLRNAKGDYADGVILDLDLWLILPR